MHARTYRFVIRCTFLASHQRPTTLWGRLIRERGWRRSRVRVYPAGPKVGIRASRLNEYWHVDASIIRLVDRTRV